MNANRNIDSLVHRKRNKKITTSYKRSYNRLKIDKTGIQKNTKILLPMSLVACSVLLLLFVVSQSKIYKVLSLIHSIQNESVLVGFQNSAELRPTGGFWGSFAILDAKSSILDSTIYFDTNPYKQDNILLKESQTILPEPMRQFWKDRPQSFVNANWPASFPESAKTLEWYLGQGWGDKNISGVVALSSLSMIDLLKLTGPITLNDNTTVDSANFTRIMSEKIDSEYWLNEQNKSINEPKTVIKELFPKIVDKTKQLRKLTIYNFLIEQMGKGRVQAYFNDAGLAKTVDALNISGDLKPYKSDYLFINNANINGNKTSLNITEHIDYEVKSVDEGSLVSKLSLTRSHAPLWPYARNTNYTRIFTPLGSILESVTMGADDITKDVLTTQESGRSVFGFWFDTDGGQQKTAYIKYRLPDDIHIENYSLTYQKQSGTIGNWLNIQVSDKILFVGKFDISSKIFASR